MFFLKDKNDRGLTQTSWLKSRHSFSFAEYYDPKNMGFGPLRVINEDWVAPGKGFDTHGHRNMEILTYVLKGELAHKDSLGNGSAIRHGDIQMMSAGKGILHSEFNPSDKDEVHLLQIWIMPDESNTPPGYQQKVFAPEGRQNGFQLIASADGANGSLVIRQNARVFAANAAAGKALNFTADAKRKYWLQVARGSIRHGDKTLAAGDALALEKEAGVVSLTATEEAEILLFDLPQ